MEVSVYNDPVKQQTIVLIELGTDDHGVMHFMDERGAAVPVLMGQEPPTYMTIPIQVAKAIGEALAPRPEASARHLNDAIEVRDRLLSLVERQWTTST